MRTAVCWTDFSSYCLLYFILGDSCWKISKSWRYILSRMTEYFLLETYPLLLFDQPLNQITPTGSWITVEAKMLFFRKKEKVLIKEMGRRILRWAKFYNWFVYFSTNMNTLFFFFLLKTSYLLLKTSIVWHGDITERFSIKKDCELGLDRRLF